MEYINGSELANNQFIKLENEDLREAPKGKFIPKIGERYYCVKYFGDVQCFENDSELDKWLFKHHLVFRTREECEDYRDFLETLDQYTFEPNWEDPSQEKWFMCFDREDHRIGFATQRSLQYHSLCFESYEKAMAFVDAVGKEAIEQYMFDYWR